MLWMKTKNMYANATVKKNQFVNETMMIVNDDDEK